MAFTFNYATLLQVNLSKADVAVSWFKGSTSVEKSDKYEISSEGTVHTLVIKNATEEDIAEYACAAENVRRSCSTSISTFIWIWAIQPSVGLTQGSTFRLIAVYSGSLPQIRQLRQ